MKVVVNGVQMETEDSATVRDLLVRLGLEGRPVAVELNRKVIPRAEHAKVVLAEGDKVEIVTLVGGG